MRLRNLPACSILLAGLVTTSGDIFAAQRRMITAAVDENRRGRMQGHIHPLARPENDQGPVDPTRRLAGVTLELRQSPEQKAELDRLLAAQQDPSSPEYHHWLTPEQFADRFGAAQEDIDQIVAWLTKQNLQVTGVSRARTSITLTGSAADMDHAFRTSLHRYLVNGRSHFANSEEPSLPVALEPAIRDIHGLNNFRMQPRAVRPKYTAGSGTHYLSPDDVGTIYDLKPLWSRGYDGTGQKIVIAGQTQIDPSDIQTFRAKFQLPASDPTILLVPNTTDPGVSQNDVPEADLDLEWAGATAPHAQLIYVYSENVTDAVQYAIDQNLAPVISSSYGLCETLSLPSDVLTMQTWARQANAQGITWVNAAGDSGGADCVSSTSNQAGGPSVDTPASIPEVTGIGGTEFNEGSAQYWNATNAANGGSALSYIAEKVWNDSTPDDPAAGGGGASVLFAKPSWQVGNGVPANSARNVPDIALAASADHDGYMVYTGGQLNIYGGTSAATPTVAGMVAVLNHFLVATGRQTAPGVGNINPRLYQLAEASAAAFHDVTTGDNIVTVTCGARSRNCVSGSYGFAAAAGYDQASGLGSVDAFNLVNAWAAGGTNRTTPTVTLQLSAPTLTPSGSESATITVAGGTSTTPTGTVTLLAGTDTIGSVALSGSGGTAAATLTIFAAQLQPGSNSLSAFYSGDANFTTADATAPITVTSAPAAPPSIAGLTNGASFTAGYAPGMALSIFGSNLATGTLVASNVPLPASLSNVSVTIGATPAPLYYVSPTQINAQIPYQVALNQMVTVTVNNLGRTATASMIVRAAAPGVFTDSAGTLVPINTAALNQAIPLFITGAGAVSPALATGAAPAAGTPVSQLPAPIQGVSVTIGGVDASLEFAGIPQGLVGVVQVNVRVDAKTPLGLQPVVVTVGGVPSIPAQLNVTSK
jgi:uncharacterized protein (TIGR03437 family)